MKKRYKYAINAIGWVYTVLLAVVYCSIIHTAANLESVFWQKSFDAGNGILHCFRHLWVIITILLTLIIVLLSKVWRRKKWKPFSLINALSKKYHFALITLIILTLPLLYMVWDIPAQPLAYSTQDLHMPSESVEESYRQLMQFRKDGGLEVPDYLGQMGLINKVTISNVLEHAEAVEDAWVKLTEFRHEFYELDNYEGIAGITPTIEPSFADIDILAFTKVRSVVWSTVYYSVLLTEKGESEKAVEHLLKLYSIHNKAIPYAATLVDKMIWVATGDIIVMTLHEIIHSPKCSQATKDILAESFTPLPLEFVSVINPFICEYVAGCNSFDDMDYDTLTSWGFGEHTLNRTAFNIALPFISNPNLAMKVSKKSLEDLLQWLKQPPHELQYTGSAEIQAGHFVMKNILWQCMGGVSSWGYSQYAYDSLVSKIRNDLLALEINKMTAKTIELTDPLSNKPYFINSAGRYASVGRDHKPNTRDDIISDDLK